jgi:hypothetical protein
MPKDSKSRSMSKFKLTLLCLILAFLALVIPAFSQSPLEYEHYFPDQKVSGTGTIDISPFVIDKSIKLEQYVKPDQEHPMEKVISPSWAFSSINSGNISVPGKTSELAKTIIITKITPTNGEIILNNTNKTMPVNVSGWHLEVLSINHPEKEVIANGSVIRPLEQLVVSILPLDSSGVASLADSTGQIIDRVPYAGNWTKANKS